MLFRSNEDAPEYARIFKEMILVAQHDKPMPRSGLGGIMRKPALALYADEINELHVSPVVNRIHVLTDALGIRLWRKVSIPARSPYPKHGQLKT